MSKKTNLFTSHSVTQSLTNTLVGIRTSIVVPIGIIRYSGKRSPSTIRYGISSRRLDAVPRYHCSQIIMNFPSKFAFRDRTRKLSRVLMTASSATSFERGSIATPVIAWLVYRGKSRCEKCMRCPYSGSLVWVIKFPTNITYARHWRS